MNEHGLSSREKVEAGRGQGQLWKSFVINGSYETFYHRENCIVCIRVYAMIQNYVILHRNNYSATCPVKRTYCWRL